jgi:hypothetical protein
MVIQLEYVYYTLTLDSYLEKRPRLLDYTRHVICFYRTKTEHSVLLHKPINLHVLHFIFFLSHSFNWYCAFFIPVNKWHTK